MPKNPGYGVQFGGEGGGGGFVVPASASIPFASTTARDTWATANRSDLIANQTVVSVGTSSPFTWYLWRGATNPGTYVNTDWSNATPILQGEDGSPGANGAALMFKSNAVRDSFFSQAANRALLETNLPIVVSNGGTATTNYIWKGMDSPATYSNTLWETASLITASGTLYLGGINSLSLSSTGENAAFLNGATNIAYHPVWQTFGAGNTGTVRVRGAELDTVVSSKTTDLTNPSWTQTASTNETIRQVVVDFTNNAPAFELVGLVNSAEFFRRSFPAQSAGEQTLVFNPPLDLRMGESITLSLASTGDVVVKGANGVPWQTITSASWIDRAVITSEDVDNTSTTTGLWEASKIQAVVDAVDTTSVEEIQDTVAGMISSGTTTGMSITYNDTAGTLDFTVNAQTLDAEGVQDIVGGMITGNVETGIAVTYDDASGKLNFSVPTLDTEAVQDIIGAMVSGNTETNISVTYDDANGKLDFNSTQLSAEEIQDIVGAMVSGNIESNIAVTYDDTNGKLDFTAINTQLTLEEVQDIVGGMVTSNTETGLDVTYDDPNGKLNFALDTESIQDIIGAMVSGNTETGISVTYDDTNGKLNFVIGSTPGAAESFYHGTSATNNPATVDTATLTSSSVGTGTGQTFNFNITNATAGHYVILLVPADHDLSSLVNTGSGFSVLSSFTKTENVRMINSNQYHSYVLGPVVSGFSATYRATLA